jgi:hypothetical protein
MGLLQVGGIISVPDIPLMLFVVLFFLAYRRYSRNQGLFETILVGVTVAGMLYSKYHGILVVFFTLLSNFKLVRKWQTWLAALVALLLFMPHLYWQFMHDNPSVRYHLYERNAAYYKFEYTMEYVIGQILLAGPLIGWLLLWAGSRKVAVSDTEKALKWCLFGIYGFFLLSTFKGRVEANWTAPAFIPLVVLSHQYLTDHTAASRWVYRLFIPSLMIVLLVRLYMIVDMKPYSLFPKDEFHKNREWSEAVLAKAVGSPVVFLNSYQRPSQFYFYSGIPSFGLNNIYYRRNNYNFWPLESRLIGRRVLVVSHEDHPFFRDKIHSARGVSSSAMVDPYFSFSQVDIRSSASIRCIDGRMSSVLSVKIPESEAMHEQYGRFDTAQIVLSIFKRDKKRSLLIQTGARLRSVRNGSIEVDFKMPAEIGPGHYKARWGINTAIPGSPSLNSSGFEVEVR